MNKVNKQRGDAELVIQIVIVSIVGILILGIPIINMVKAYGTQRYETIFVNKSERITEGKSSRYLVYTKEGVYENTDSLFLGKFNSSDLYNQIQQNKQYECLVTGWRIPFFSDYPNLIKCEEKS